MYYFNGDSAYLAFRTLQGSSYLRTVSVNIKTASEDGLIMFYAEGDELVSIYPYTIYINCFMHLCTSDYSVPIFYYHYFLLHKYCGTCTYLCK